MTLKKLLHTVKANTERVRDDAYRSGSRRFVATSVVVAAFGLVLLAANSDAQTWFTNTAVSSARLYWESKLAFFAPKHLTIPVAVSAFPGELYQAPRSWTERAYPKLIYYDKLDKGGHFAAWEQPELFTQEIRAAFRSLR